MSTIQAIAASTGLSANTVSRVLRGHIKGHRKDAVERSQLILETARAMGYRLNNSARAMRTGRFNAIGLLQAYEMVRSNLPERVLWGIHTSVLEANLHLVSSRLSDSQLVSGGYMPKVLRELMVDGLLICYECDTPPTMMELIQEHQIPSVWLNMVQPHNSVRPDDRQGGRIATEHLLRQGHRRIAFADLEHTAEFMWSERAHYSLKHRYQGYADAMAAAGLQTQMLNASVDREHNSLCLPPLNLDWLEAVDRPTALVAYASWGLLRAALRAEHLFGSRKSLSIVTFGEQVQTRDDLLIDTVLLPHAQIGRNAVAMLEKRIAAPDIDHESEVIPCELHGGFSVFSV